MCVCSCSSVLRLCARVFACMLGQCACMLCCVHLGLLVATILTDLRIPFFFFRSLHSRSRQSLFRNSNDTCQTFLEGCRQKQVCEGCVCVWVYMFMCVFVCVWANACEVDLSARLPNTHVNLFSWNLRFFYTKYYSISPHHLGAAANLSIFVFVFMCVHVCVCARIYVSVCVCKCVCVCQCC